jgi:hypothetical protein
MNRAANRYFLERIGVMVLPMDSVVGIENPRKYPPEVVGELHALLSAGHAVQQDPRRKNIYEVQGSNSTFYFYASHSTQTIVLLAKWSRAAESSRSMEMSCGIA